MRRSLIRTLTWMSVAATGALAFSAIALHRGEAINAIWLVVAALCSYALGYRFYSKFIAVKVLAIDPARATPAERLDDGRDFVPTNRWVVFGHHFAAIAGPGPLVGPVLAAQFGFLPGTLWILVGAVFGGCVQDFVILLFSVRRDGKSLGQMAKEEIGRLGGFVAFVAVIAILVILLGVVVLVVVNALKSSPWSTFVKLGTIAVLAVGIIVLRPTLHMPALTSFAGSGDGPVFAGKIFPFAFITITCGAVSGFHALISSGTTPKLIARETQTRMVG